MKYDKIIGEVTGSKDSLNSLKNDRYKLLAKRRDAHMRFLDRSESWSSMNLLFFSRFSS